MLNLFSYQAMKHTIVLTTDDEPRGSIFASRNNTIHGLIEECGGGHLKFSTVSTGWRFELFRRTEEILKKDVKNFSSVMCMRMKVMEHQWMEIRADLELQSEEMMKRRRILITKRAQKQQVMERFVKLFLSG